MITKVPKRNVLSQLTLVALILLVAFLWKFGPWFRSKRILSYEFPIGWWNHVALIDPQHSLWSKYKRNQLEDFVRLFIDQVEIIPADDLKEDLQIKHRVAIATQFFLVTQNIKPDPFKTLERIYLQNFKDEVRESNGLMTFYWEDKIENFQSIISASTLNYAIYSEDKPEIANYLTGKEVSNPETKARLDNIFGQTS